MVPGATWSLSAHRARHPFGSLRPLDGAQHEQAAGSATSVVNAAAPVARVASISYATTDRDLGAGKPLAGAGLVASVLRNGGAYATRNGTTDRRWPGHPHARQCAFRLLLDDRDECLGAGLGQRRAAEPLLPLTSATQVSDLQSRSTASRGAAKDRNAAWRGPIVAQTSQKGLSE